jgi:hypothetical protein
LSKIDPTFLNGLSRIDRTVVSKHDIRNIFTRSSANSVKFLIVSNFPLLPR